MHPTLCRGDSPATGPSGSEGVYQQFIRDGGCRKTNNHLDAPVSSGGTRTTPGRYRQRGPQLNRGASAPSPWIALHPGSGAPGRRANSRRPFCGPRHRHVLFGGIDKELAEFYHAALARRLGGVCPVPVGTIESPHRKKWQHAPANGGVNRTKKRRDCKRGHHDRRHL